MQSSRPAPSGSRHPSLAEIYRKDLGQANPDRRPNPAPRPKNYIQKNCRTSARQFSVSVSEPQASVYLDALLGEVLQGTRMPGNPRILRLLVLDLDVESFFVNQSEIRTFLEHGLGQLVGQIRGKIVSDGHDVPHAGNFVFFVLIGIGTLGND